MGENSSFLYAVLCLSVCDRFLRRDRAVLILKEGEPAVRDYIGKFLSAGDSADPIDILKAAGVDMSSPKPIEEALGLFEELIGQMEEITGESLE